MLGFEKIKGGDFRENLMSNLFEISGELDSKQLHRLKTIIRNWDFRRIFASYLNLKQNGILL